MQLIFIRTVCPENQQPNVIRTLKQLAKKQGELTTCAIWHKLRLNKTCQFEEDKDQFDFLPNELGVGMNDPDAVYKALILTKEDGSKKPSGGVKTP